MTENQKQVPNSDEVDLVYLFSKLGDFFKNLGLGIIRFVALMRRIPLENKVLFIILTIVGLAGGISYATLLKKQFYSTTMILSSEYLNKRIVENSIKTLNLLAGEKDKKGLAGVLNISDSLASNIHSFETKSFVSEEDLVDLEVLKKQLKRLLDVFVIEEEEKQIRDKEIEQVLTNIAIENSHSYEITVSVYNPTVVHELEKALVNYFKNNNFIKNRLEITKSNKLAKRQKLIRDAQKIDSLKSIIYANYQRMADKKSEGSNNIILSEKAIANPIEIFEMDIELQGEIQSIERSLFLQDDFELVAGFTEFSKPSSVGPVRISAYGILIAVGLGYLLIALSRFNKYLQTIE